MTETVPFTEAKAHLSDLVDRTSREHERFVVTRNGRPAAVLLSPEDLESLAEGAPPILEALFGASAEKPGRAGKPLRGELEGLYSARRGEFRVIYEIDEAAHVVLVHRAQHRRGVYRSR